jgi:antitoxin ParD1/3/4
MAWSDTELAANFWRIAQLAKIANCDILGIESNCRPSRFREFHMPTRNVNLTDHFDQFVEKEIGAGRYRNASEVMRAGLRLLEQQKREEREKLKLLRSLAAEGFKQLDQGLGIELKDEREIRSFMGKIGRGAAKKAKRHSRNN